MYRLRNGWFEGASGPDWCNSVTSAAVREAYRQHIPARGYHPEPRFVIAELVNSAGVVGAADLARQHSRAG